MTTAIPSRGFLYIVAGAARYLDECAISIQSLRAAIPDAHITLITTESMATAHQQQIDTLVDHLEIVAQKQLESTDAQQDRQQWRTGLLFKTRFLYEHCPYQEAIFLDTDTYIVSDCSHLFDLLSTYDVAIAPTPGDWTPIQGTDALVAPAHHNLYNTGVIAFRKNETTHALFSQWLAIYRAKHDRYPNDQAAFTEAVSKSNCKIYMLRPIYNARIHFPLKLAGEAIILHSRTDDWASIIQRINITDHTRFWFPFLQACYWDEMPLHRFIIFCAKLLFFRVKQLVKAMLKLLGWRR